MKKVIEKYSSLSNSVKASLWFMVCSIVSKAISFFTIPVFTRLLSSSQYGEFSLFLAWQEFITIFATLNLNYQIFNNGMVKFKNDKDGYTTSMVGLAFITGSITLVFLSLIYPIWLRYTHITYIFLVLMSINMFFSFIFGLWAVRNRYDYKYKLLTLLTILMAFFNPLLGILFVKLSSQKVLLRVLSIVVTYILFGTIAFLLLIRRSKKIICREYWKFALSLSLPLIPHYVSMVVLHSSDRIMIGNIAGAQYTAFYSVSYNVAFIMQIVFNAINASFVPFVYKNMEKKCFETIRKYSLLIIVIVAILCVIPMFFAPEVVYILGGKNYMDATTIIPILSSSVFMIFFYSIFVIIEMFYEKSKFITIGTICAALLNIVLNAFCIKIFGYKAAAYTTLISYVALAFFHYIMYKKVLYQNKIYEDLYNTKIMIIISIVLCLISVVISVIYNSMILRYGLFVVLLLVVLLNINRINSIFKEIKK